MVVGESHYFIESLSRVIRKYITNFSLVCKNPNGKKRTRTMFFVLDITYQICESHIVSASEY